ncbi:hypothetical protein [Rheinheimera sp.]|uniref:hypothetical protein n=1 Tax=Rheinheimera sp. TaxID=1869214 RepID=UPI003D2E3C3A
MMAPVLALLATLGFLAAMVNLFLAKPSKQRQAQKLVLFFGYTSLAFLFVLPSVVPVGGGL